MASAIFSFGDIRPVASSVKILEEAAAVGAWPWIGEGPVGDFSSRGGLNVTQRGGVYFHEVPGYRGYADTETTTTDPDAWHSNFTGITIKTPAFDMPTVAPRTRVFLNNAPVINPIVSASFAFQRSAMVIAPHEISMAHAVYPDAASSSAETNPSSSVHCTLSAGNGMVTNANTLQLGSHAARQHRIVTTSSDLGIQRLDVTSGSWNTLMSLGASGGIRTDTNMIEFGNAATAGKYRFRATANDIEVEQYDTSANQWVGQSSLIGGGGSAPVSSTAVEFGDSSTGLYRLHATVDDVDLEKYNASTSTWEPTTFSSGASTVQATRPDGTIATVAMRIDPGSSPGDPSILRFSIVENGVHQGVSVALGGS